METGRLAGLDALRGIAALCVVCLHAPVSRFMGNSQLAVDFFFLLSGYVMARTYGARLSEGMAPSEFVGIRFRRLWPVMALGGLLGLPAFFHDFGSTMAVVAALNLLLLPVLVWGHGFPLNGPAWSVFVELVANAIHGLFLRHLPLRGLVLLVAGMIGFFILLPHFPHAVTPAFRLAIGLCRALLAYPLGMILWAIWRDRPDFAVPPLLAFVAMPLVFVGTGLFGIETALGNLAFVVIICPLILAGGLRFSAGRTGLRIATWIGALSFPLYAVHVPVLRGFALVGVDWRLGLLTSLALAGAIVAGQMRLARWQRARRSAARLPAMV